MNGQQWVTIPGTGIEVTLMKVTPDQAREWLNQSGHVNRKPKPGRIKAFAADMAHTPTRWRSETGEAIKFGHARPDGTRPLVDGQNRLLGVIQADVPVELMVMRNIPEKNQTALDTGTTRTLSDMFTILGVSEPSTTAAITNNIYAYEKSQNPLTIRSYSHSLQEAMDFYNVHQTLIDQIVPLSKRLSYRSATAGIGMRLTVSGWGLWVLKNLDPSPSHQASVDFFFNRLLDPTYKISNGLHPAIDRTREAVERTRKDEPYARAALIKGWNLFVKGDQETKRITWAQGTERRDPFPMPLVAA